MSESDITPDHLRSLFAYDPITGVVRNRIRRSSNALAGSSVGTHCGRGYLRVKIDTRRYKLHRVVWTMYYGRWPEEEIDHINGVRDDNRIANLREASRTENNRNSSMRKDNSTGIAGVYWHKTHSKWAASIRVDGKHLHLGLFDDFFEACCTRKSAENKYGFHPNHGKTAEVRAAFTGS